MKGRSPFSSIHLRPSKQSPRADTRSTKTQKMETVSSVLLGVLSSPLLVNSSGYLVRHTGCVQRRSYIMGANDVGALGNPHGFRSQGTEQAIAYRSIMTILSKRASNKRFARCAHQQRKAQTVQFIKPFQ